MDNVSFQEIEPELLEYRLQMLKAQEQTLAYGLKLLSKDNRTDYENSELQKCIGHFNSVINTGVLDAFQIEKSEYQAFLDLASQV